MKLSGIIYEKDICGQFVTMEPNLTNKQVCDAKRLLRDSMELHGIDQDSAVFVVNDEEGKVGYRAVKR